MKKTIALLIAVIMLFSLLAACAGDTPAPAAAPDAPAEPPGGDAPITGDVSITANEIGLFFDGVDPFSRRTYDIVLSYMRPMPLWQNVLDALVEWEAVFNFNTIEFNANGDIDFLLQNIEIFAAQGVDGFLIVIDATATERIVEVLDSTGLPYIAMLNSARDEQGRSIAPTVGIEGVEAGRQITRWLYDNHTYFWGEIDTSAIGLLNFDFSPNADFHDRHNGALAMFQELLPNNAGIFPADGVTGGLNEQTGFDLASAILAANPQVEYWFIPSTFEHYAQGAARAVDSLGMSDRVLITSVAVDILTAAWDAGYEGRSYVGGLAFCPLQYTAPAISGLIALINGTATAETLWSHRRLPTDIYTFFEIESEIVTRDKYQDFFARVRAASGLPER